jgi:hypothetical protein
LMANVSHIPIVSLLSENDKRLESGVKLKRLRDLPKVLRAIDNGAATNRLTAMD